MLYAACKGMFKIICEYRRNYMNNIPKYTLWRSADAVLLEIEGLLAGMAELTEMSEMA